VLARPKRGSTCHHGGKKLDPSSFAHGFGQWMKKNKNRLVGDYSIEYDAGKWWVQTVSGEVKIGAKDVM
jgi:hypothetical protein